MKKIPIKGNTVYSKFQPKYQGPFTVVRVLRGGLTYVLSFISTDGVRAHHHQLIPWNEPPDYPGSLPRYNDLVGKALETLPKDTDTSSDFLECGLSLTVSSESSGRVVDSSSAEVQSQKAAGVLESTGSSSDIFAVKQEGRVRGKEDLSELGESSGPFRIQTWYGGGNAEATDFDTSSEFVFPEEQRALLLDDCVT